MRWLGCLLIAANCVSVSAQVVPSAMGPGAFVAAGAGPSYFEAIYGQRHLAGFYAYAEVQPQWRWGFEGEARYLRWHTSEGVNESDYLGGVRGVMFRWHGLEPYGKLLAGAGKIKLPFNDGHGSFLAVAPGAGLDLPLNEFVTVRVVDFEYQHWFDFPFGTFNPYGISSSVRIRITPPARVPQSVRKRGVHGPTVDGSG